MDYPHITPMMFATILGVLSILIVVVVGMIRLSVVKSAYLKSQSGEHVEDDLESKLKAQVDQLFKEQDEIFYKLVEDDIVLNPRLYDLMLYFKLLTTYPEAEAYYTPEGRFVINIQHLRIYDRTTVVAHPDPEDLIDIRHYSRIESVIMNNHDLINHERMILEYVSLKDVVTRKDIEKLCKVGRTSAWNKLTKLKEEGKLISKRTGHTTLYMKPKDME